MADKEKFCWRPAALIAVGIMLVTVIRVLPRFVARYQWAKHEEVIVRTINGESGSLAEFQDAVDFFYGLSGIGSSADHSYVGALPTPSLSDDLKKWRAWYEANREKIYWDFFLGEARVE